MDNSAVTGGFLPFELPLAKCGPYYAGEGVLALNAGRYAGVYALKHSGAKRVWLPHYLCRTLYLPIRKAGIEIAFYHLNEDFTPKGISAEKTDAVWWVNYWGLVSRETLLRIREKFQTVIADCTQAFFVPPEEGVYTIYSCRKFFGVADGGYLVRRGIDFEPLERGESWRRSVSLLKGLDRGELSALSDRASSERDLASEGVKGMSRLTERILESIDYEPVKRKRLENYGFLEKLLSSANLPLFPPPCEAPMNYVFLTDNPKVRERLWAQGMDIAVYWPHLLKMDGLEGRLSSGLLALPVDQRYEKEDMERVAKCVLEAVEER